MISWTLNWYINWYLTQWQKCSHGGLSKRKMYHHNLASDDRSSARSLIKMKNRKGSKMDPSGTSALTPVHEEACPFKVTHYFQSFNMSGKTRSSLPETPFGFQLNIFKWTTP